MNETEVCANTRILPSSQKKEACNRSPEHREWVSIIECVSATGQKLLGSHLQRTEPTDYLVPCVNL
jgi:hypothetical protein